MIKLCVTWIENTVKNDYYQNRNSKFLLFFLQSHSLFEKIESIIFFRLKKSKVSFICLGMRLNLVTQKFSKSDPKNTKIGCNKIFIEIIFF